MKRFIAGFATCMVLCILFGIGYTALADQPIKLIVNGKEITCDVPPQIINGRTMVPARYVAEALGASVQWDPDNYAVVVTGSEAAETPTQNNSTEPTDLTTIDPLESEANWMSLTDLARSYKCITTTDDKQISINFGEKTWIFVYPDSTVEASMVVAAPGIRVKSENNRYYVFLPDLRKYGFID